MGTVGEHLLEINRQAHRELVEQQEAYILQFFGSIENVLKYGWLYVLEEDYPPIVVIDGTNFHLETKTRIRGKTEEEMRRELGGCAT